MRPLAKPNYQHEKRQKDLAKKKKKEEKMRRKAEKAHSPNKEENPEVAPAEGTEVSGGEPPAP
jgi:hypothetical protein